eukprot:scaffold32618_cov141-Skeletonema_marinoi.AAC.2
MGSAPTSSANGTVASRNPYFNFSMSAVIQRFSFYYCKAKSYIYDALILTMTEAWYRAVLEKMPDGSTLLDVGIGTGGALLRCTDLLVKKDLKVVGIDIDSAYVEAGHEAILYAGMDDRISINVVNVYEAKEKVMELVKQMGGSEDSDGRFVDAVYFSGSFSLLPDPVKALHLVSEFVKTKDGEKGSIFITQTYQRKTPFFLPYMKPLLKYATTIDFGQLVTEEDILRTFEESRLEVVQHEVIPGSVDNSLQAAYLSILR